ncbi:MAG: hypothetical protein HONDAALG_04148 [Gammaproteobacteria bacterium]|nr:hypothetical protein [Gammaproteobacteria bacterium]
MDSRQVIKEALDSERIPNTIKSFIPTVQKEFLEIGKEQGADIKIDLSYGLLGFNFINQTANSTSGMFSAVCHIVPFNVRSDIIGEIGAEGCLKRLVTQTIKLRKLDVVEHIKILQKEEPETICFVDVKLKRERRQEVIKDLAEGRDNFSDSERNEMDDLYFSRDKIAAFPIPLMGVPILTCYLDDREDVIRKEGERPVRQHIVNNLLLPAGQTVFTYFFSQLIEMAIESMASTDRFSQVAKKFLLDISCLLCAKRFTFRDDTILENVATIREFPDGATLKIEIPDESGQFATIVLPAFKEERGGSSEVLNAKQQVEQIQKLLKTLVQLIYDGIELRDKRQQMGKALEVARRLTGIKSDIDALIDWLLPSARESNRRTLKNVIIPLCDDSNNSIKSFSNKQLNILTTDLINGIADAESKSSLADYLRDIPTNCTVNEIVKEIANLNNCPDDMAHFFHDVSIYSKCSDLERDIDIRNKIEKLSLLLLLSLIDSKKSEPITFDIVAICDLLCTSWIKYPSDDHPRKRWFQMALLCRDLGSDISTKELSDILYTENSEIDLLMLSTKSHSFRVKIEYDPATSVPSGSFLLSLGCLKLIPSVEQKSLTWNISTDNDYLVNKVELQESRTRQSRKSNRTDRLPSLPITKLSDMWVVLGKFFETIKDPQRGDDKIFTWRMKIR